MKVYAVSSGTYSDYSIRRVFANLDDAEWFCAIENYHSSGYGDGHRVEVWEVEETRPTQIVEWTAIAHERNSFEVDVRSTVLWNTEDKEEFRVYERGELNHPILWKQWYVMATGTDREQVTKVVADRAAVMKAHKEGIA